MEPFFLVFWLFFLANIVLVIWALVDAIKVPDDSMYQAGSKVVWVLVILLGGFIGAIVYLVVGRPKSGHRLRSTPPWDGSLPPPPPGSVG
jgi:hypothetical protein